MHRYRLLRRLLCALMTGGLLLPTIGIAQFEGIIDMKVSMSDGDSLHAATYRMHVQKDKMAATLEGGAQGMQGGSFIFRGDRKLLWIVNDEQKSYLEVSLKDVDTASAGEETPERGKLERTGKTKTILAYLCEEFVVHGEAEVIQIWATTKLGNVYEGLMKSFGELGGSQMKDQAGWEGQLSAMKLFPLTLVTTRNGALYEKQEVTRIEAKKLAPSVFEPPRSYKKEALNFDMEKMMKQMQQKQEEPDSSDE